jgi:RNA polymerase sigma factor (sigma-70 family)
LDISEEHISSVIEGCIQGSRKAQQQLYANYYRALMNLCLRYTKNEADAMAALNTGFLKIFRNIQRYDPAQASLYTWMRTVVVNSCLDAIKARQREISAYELEEATQVEIEAEVVSKMKAGEILGMVQKLPSITQAVFNLYVMEGHGHKEIGQLLNMPEGTSKWHLSEARRILKQQISG